MIFMFLEKKTPYFNGIYKISQIIEFYINL